MWVRVIKVFKVLTRKCDIWWGIKECFMVWRFTSSWQSCLIYPEHCLQTEHMWQVVDELAKIIVVFNSHFPTLFFSDLIIFFLHDLFVSSCVYSGKYSHKLNYLWKLFKVYRNFFHPFNLKLFLNKLKPVCFNFFMRQTKKSSIPMYFYWKLHIIALVQCNFKWNFAVEKI